MAPWLEICSECSKVWHQVGSESRAEIERNRQALEEHDWSSELHNRPDSPAVVCRPPCIFSMRSFLQDREKDID